MPVAAPAGGTVTTLAVGQQGPDRITVDDTHVYWTVQNLPSVMKVSKLGGDPETIASFPVGDSPQDVVADAAGVFIAARNVVMALDRNSGDYASVVSGFFYTLALDGDTLYLGGDTLESLARPPESCVTNQSCASSSTTLVGQGSVRGMVTDFTYVSFSPVT